MTTPKVCICIPCYNNAKTIAFTLESILAQDYPNIIIKIFDNGSTDGTTEIIRSLISDAVPIELHSRSENIGAEANFNSCIEHAEGEFCSIFHADDVYDPDIISKQVSFLSGRPACSAVSTHARFISADGSVLAKGKMLPAEFNRSPEKEFSRVELVKLLYKYGNTITCPSVLFRTQVLKLQIVKFRSELFRSSSDLDVWFRLLEIGTFGFISQPLMSYRLSDASYSYNLAKARVDDSDMFLVLDHYLDFYAAEDRGLHTQLERHKNFLLMRDRAVTNANRLIRGTGHYSKMGLCSNALTAGASLFHAESYALSLFVKLLMIIPYGQKIAACLKRG